MTFLSLRPFSIFIAVAVATSNEIPAWNKHDLTFNTEFENQKVQPVATKNFRNYVFNQ